MRAGIAAAFALALTIASCSTSGGSDACANAAVQQATAEQTYGGAIESHEAAHASGGDHSDQDVFDARVAMILAEAETRRKCG